MLLNVLKEIKEARLYSKSHMARNLNISEEILEDMVQQLIRMGYIKEDLGSPTCESKCSGCSISSCNTIPIKMISLTEKGEVKVKSS